MPNSPSILERLRWKVGLGLVVIAAAAAHAAPATDSPASSATARSSWSTEADFASAKSSDELRSSWS